MIRILAALVLLTACSESKEGGSTEAPAQPETTASTSPKRSKTNAAPAKQSKDCAECNAVLGKLYAAIEAKDEPAMRSLFTAKAISEGAFLDNMRKSLKDGDKRFWDGMDKLAKANPRFIAAQRKEGRVDGLLEKSPGPMLVGFVKDDDGWKIDHFH